MWIGKSQLHKEILAKTKIVYFVQLSTNPVVVHTTKSVNNRGTNATLEQLSQEINITREWVKQDVYMT